MATRLIANPASGDDAALAHLPEINLQLRQTFGEIDIVLTTASGDAETAARHAVEAGYDHLFIAGGDGTLNEVLNGVAAAGGLDRTTLGVIPLGTGNDFAQALDLPEDVTSALAVLCQRHTIAVDVGTVDGRHFVNVSAGGFLAEVSDAVSPQLKSLTGKLAYLIGGAKVLFDFEDLPTNFRVCGEDGRIIESQRDIQAYAVCNARLVGGGRLIAPAALVDDGLLDLCIVDAMPTLDFVALLSQVSSGEHVSDPRVTTMRARWIELTFGRQAKINTDGEVLATERCRYEVLPRAARFLAGAAPFVLATALPGQEGALRV